MSVKSVLNKGILLLLFVISVTTQTDAQNLNYAGKEGPLGTMVNTLTGNLFIERSDFFIPARGMSFDISFGYNSYHFNKDFGYGKGWVFQYNIRYKNSGEASSKAILWGDGREDIYELQSGTDYTPPTGFFTDFSEYESGKFLLKQPGGLKYYFDDPVFKGVTKMEDPNGNYIQFIYTDSLLTSMTNEAGQTVSFTYDVEGRLASVVDEVSSPNRTYYYTYDSGGNLTEVRDPLNGKSKYSYLVNGPMKDLMDKNENKVNIIYYPNFAVRELVGCNKRISFSYDTRANTTVTTDHLETGNQVTKYVYKKINGLKLLASKSGNCCGYDVSFEYDEQGNIIKRTEPNGKVYTYTYDSRGNMLTEKDPEGGTITYAYTDDFNQISRIVDPKGNEYNMLYDSKGNMTQVTSPDNGNIFITYNANGDVIGTTDALGNSYSYTYDAFGNVTLATGPEGSQSGYTYDAAGRVLAYTDAYSHSVNAEYDVLGRLIKVTDPFNQRIQMTYDAEGNMVTYQNEDNEIVNLNYDASNRLVKILSPTGEQTKFRYDGMNNLLSLINPNNNETRFSYNDINRVENITDPEGNTQNMEYDATGNITRVYSPNGRILNYTYDGLNRLSSVTDDKGSVAHFSYDKNSNLVSVTNATGAISSFTYDNMNRVQTETDPLGNTITYAYDKNSNITGITDREGRTTFFTYDNLGRIKTTKDNLGAVVTLGYDNESNITSLTDQNGNVTTYTYDELGRKKRTVFPDGKFNEISYDSKGLISQILLEDGGRISYQYDVLGRVMSRTMPDGEVYSYTYDNLDRVLTATNNAGTVSFTYDVLNRITSEIFDGKTVHYNYNISGRTQSTTYPDNSVVTKEFDTRNRLIKISKDGLPIVSYEYNNADQLVKKTLGNGATSIMQYDQANRPANLVTTTAAGIVQNTIFSYDKEGNKTSSTRIDNPALSEFFTYDNNYRLIQYKKGPEGSPVIQNSYTYDAVGNRTSANLNGTIKNYSINNLNQVIAVDGINKVYDNRGNLIDDGVFFKTYDADNRLIKDSSSPIFVIKYSYDAFGRRIIKSFNGQTLKYTYSGVMPIEERNGSNTLLNKTVFTAFLAPILNEKDGNEFYFHSNEMGSIAAITNTAGRIIERYNYDVYGKPARTDSLGNTLASSLAGNRFGFTGQEYNEFTSDYHYFFRNYSSETGTFTQRDLLGYSDGMGLYQYVGNNPANGIDVWGLEVYWKEYSTKTNPVIGSMPPSTFMDPFFNNKGISKFLSGVNFVFGLNEASGVYKFFRGSKYKGAGKLSEYADKCINSSIKSFENFGEMAKGNIRHLRKNATAKFWSIALVGKTEAKQFFYNAEKSIVSGIKFTGEKARGIVKGGGELLSGFGKVTGVTELGYKGGKLANEMINGISDFGQDEWGALGDFAFSGLTALTGAGGALVGAVDFGAEQGSGKNILGYLNDAAYTEFRIYYQTKQFQESKKRWKEKYESRQETILECNKPKGTQDDPPDDDESETEKMRIVSPKDPNLIIGPEGQPNRAWVSVNDRLPYTILFENDSSATARARYIKITSPAEPKEDVSTFELNSVGFNGLSFDLPRGRSFIYQRLNAVDATGVFVDLNAGYDVMNNQFFWELQAIDPTTLMPPDDPNAGFLFLHDKNNPEYGNGFVSFSIKPKSSAQTLDSIAAKAFIVFDDNDTIPTNIHVNTIDAFAPVSQIDSIRSAGPSSITVYWSGTDDAKGCGLAYYTLYVSTDQINYSMLIPKTTRTDTTIVLAPGNNYCFFVLATDSVGNMEKLRQNVTQCRGVTGPVPVTWLYFNGVNQHTNNLLSWGTTSEQNTQEFRLERSFDGRSFRQIATIPAAGFSTTPRDYAYIDRDIDQYNKEVFFYRIKQVDMDNEFRYSSVVKLNYTPEKQKPTIVYPNPNDGNLNIRVGDPVLIGTDAIVCDVNGRVLKRVKIENNVQPISIIEFVNGVYLIRLANKETLKVVKY